MISISAKNNGAEAVGEDLIKKYLAQFKKEHACELLGRFHCQTHLLRYAEEILANEEIPAESKSVAMRVYSEAYLILDDMLDDYAKRCMEDPPADSKESHKCGFNEGFANAMTDYCAKAVPEIINQMAPESREQRSANSFLTAAGLSLGEQLARIVECNQAVPEQIARLLAFVCR